MAIKVYEYQNCSTCKKALKYLDTEGVKYQKIAIVEQPPKMDELKQMLQYLEAQGKSIKNLFNTSGQLYREMNVSDLIKSGASETELLKLLSKHGKLVKRPFLMAEKNGTVGFNEKEWAKII